MNAWQEEDYGQNDFARQYWALKAAEATTGRKEDRNFDSDGYGGYVALTSSSRSTLHYSSSSFHPPQMVHYHEEEEEEEPSLQDDDSSGIHTKLSSNSREDGRQHHPPSQVGQRHNTAPRQLKRNQKTTEETTLLRQKAKEHVSSSLDRALLSRLNLPYLASQRPQGYPEDRGEEGKEKNDDCCYITSYADGRQTGYEDGVRWLEEHNHHYHHLIGDDNEDATAARIHAKIHAVKDRIEREEMARRSSAVFSPVQSTSVAQRFGKGNNNTKSGGASPFTSCCSSIASSTPLEKTRSSPAAAGMRTPIAQNAHDARPDDPSSTLKKIKPATPSSSTAISTVVAPTSSSLRRGPFALKLLTTLPLATEDRREERKDNDDG